MNYIYIIIAFKINTFEARSNTSDSRCKLSLPVKREAFVAAIEALKGPECTWPARDGFPHGTLAWPAIAQGHTLRNAHHTPSTQERGVRLKRQKPHPARRAERSILLVLPQESMTSQTHMPRIPEREFLSGITLMSHTRVIVGINNRWIKSITI